MRAKVTPGRTTDHQRSSLGPSSAPKTDANSIPSEYQVRTKVAETSGQCRQYMVAAKAPEARPAAAPAAARLVGASWRNDQSMPANTGAASRVTRNEHSCQLT